MPSWLRQFSADKVHCTVSQGSECIMEPLQVCAARGARFATGADVSATQASKRCLLGMIGLLLPIQLLLIVSAIKPILSVLSDHLGYTGVAALLVYSASAFYFALGLYVLLKFLFVTIPFLDLLVLAFLVYIESSAFICPGLALCALHAAYRDRRRVNALYLAGMSSFEAQGQFLTTFTGGPSFNKTMRDLKARAMTSLRIRCGANESHSCPSLFSALTSTVFAGRFVRLAFTLPLLMVVTTVLPAVGAAPGRLKKRNGMGELVSVIFTGPLAVAAVTGAAAAFLPGAYPAKFMPATTSDLLPFLSRVKQLSQRLPL